MKTGKRWISFLLIVMMVLTLMPVSVWADVTDTAAGIDAGTEQAVVQDVQPANEVQAGSEVRADSDIEELQAGEDVMQADERTLSQAPSDNKAVEATNEKENDTDKEAANAPAPAASDSDARISDTGDTASDVDDEIVVEADEETVKKDAKDSISEYDYNSLDLSSAAPLSIGSDSITETVSLTSTATYKLFKLEVMEAGTYTFTSFQKSSEEIDPYGTLLEYEDGFFTKLESNDDGAEEYHCFTFKHYLNTSASYYLVADQCSNNNGSYKLKIDKAPVFSATFDANNGSFIDEEETEVPQITENIEEGTFLSGLSFYDRIQNVSREGYILEGWSTNPNIDPDELSEDMDTEVEAGKTYYAIWRKSVLVTLYAGEGYFDEYDEDNNYLTTYQMEAGIGKSLSALFDYPGLYRDEDEGGEWTFAGWANHENATGNDILDTEKTIINEENCVFYAVWVRNVTLTFNANGGYFDGNQSNTEYIVNVPSYMTLDYYYYDNVESIIHPDNKVLKGWETTDGILIDYLDEYVPTKNETLSAVWVDQYTITFDANGGCYWGNIENTKRELLIADGTSLGDYSIDQPGYYDNSKSFIGWQDPDGNLIEDIDEYYPKGNETLKAFWKDRIKVTVNIDNEYAYFTGDWDYENNEYEKLSSRVIYVDENSNLSYWDTNPQYDDSLYILSGWIDDATGEACDDWINPETDMSLTLIFKEICNVTFEAGAGYFYSDPSVKTQSIRVAKGETLYSTPTVNTDEEGKVFSGWYLDEECTQSVSDDTIMNTPVNEPITYYAGFEEGYTLTVDANGGYFKYYDNNKSEYVQVEQLAVTVKKDSSINIWDSYYYKYYPDVYPEDDHKTQDGYLDAEKNKISDYSNYVVTGDTTVYVNWLRSHIITYHACGGSFRNYEDPFSVKVPEEYSIGNYGYIYEGYILPPEGQENNVFSGWYTDEECTEGNKIENVYEFYPDKDMDLYAGFVEGIPVTFKTDPEYGFFYDEEGEEVAEKTIYLSPEKTYDLRNNYSPESKDDDYRFDGWLYDDGSEMDYTEIYNYIPTDPITLTAKWKRCFDITYRSNNLGYFEGYDEDTPETHGSVWEGNRIGYIPDFITTESDKALIGWKDIATERVYSPEELSQLYPTNDMTFIPELTTAYTITFDADEYGYFYGGYDDDDNEIQLQEKIITVPQGQRIGYSARIPNPNVKDEYYYSKLFSWDFQLEDGTVLNEEELNDYIPDKSQTITALYDDAAAITLNANGGYIIPEESEKHLDEIKIPCRIGSSYDEDWTDEYYFSTEKENMRFSGKLYLDPECTQPVDEDAFTVTRDQTLYAGWIEQVTLTYHAAWEGMTEDQPAGYFPGEYDEDDNPTVTYTLQADKGIYYGKSFYGNLPEVTEPLVSGAEKMAFTGWYLDPECTQPVKNRTRIEDAMDLYAKYDGAWTVTFDAGEGTFDDDEKTQEVNVSKGTRGVEEPDNPDIASEYKLFDHWSLYGSVFDAENYKPTADVTVEAAYADAYILKLDAGNGELYYDGDVYIDDSCYSYALRKVGSSVYLPGKYNITPASGKAFVGWSLDPEGTELLTTSRFTGTEGKTYTLYAIYEDAVTVTFHAGSHGSVRLYSPYNHTINADQSYEANMASGQYLSDVGMNYKPATGYLFDAWYADKACTQKVDFDEDEVKAEDGKHYYANWVKGLHVQFDTDGGTLRIYGDNEDQYVSDLYVRDDYNLGYDYDIYTPVKEGYVFDGYYEDSAFTKKIENIHAYSPTTEETTIYLKWTEESASEKCKVTFHANSDTGSGVFRYQNNRETVVVYAENGKRFNSNDYDSLTIKPSDTGKSFTNWYLDAACTEPFSFSQVITQDLNVYAGYADRITVTFHAGDGGYFDRDSSYEEVYTYSGDPGDTVYLPGVENSLQHDDSDMTFAGWYLDEALTTPLETPNNNYLPISSADHLYAKWQKSYTVYYHAGNGTIDSDRTLSQVYAVGSAADELVPKPDDAAFVFDGWHLKEDLSDDPAVTNFAFTEDTDLYAAYTNENVGTLTLDMNGGYYEDADEHESNAPILISTNGKLTLSELAADIPHLYRSSEDVYYEFCGWSPEKNAEVAVDEDNYVPQKGETLYAVWQAMVHVRFLAGEGIINYNDYNAYELDVYKDKPLSAIDEWYQRRGYNGWKGIDDILTNVEPPEGQVFMGWYTAPFGGGTKVDSSYVPTAGMTFYAHYQPDSSIVTVNSITLNPSTITLDESGKTAQITATVLPENASNKTLRWTSSKPGVATVDQNGKVTAVANGTTTITAKSVSNSLAIETATVTVAIPEKTYTVEVKKGTVTGLSADNTAHEGDTITLKADDPEAGDKFTGWTGLDAVTDPIDVTQAEVTFKMPAANIKAVATYEPILVEEVTVSAEDDQTTLKIGNQVQLTADIKPEDAKNTSVTWTSSDPTIATVTSDGLVKAVAAGEVTITATAKDASEKAGEIKITVQEDPKYQVTVEGGKLDNGETSGEFKAGQNVTVTANAPAEGKIFDKWDAEDVALEDASRKTVTFAMPENPVTLTANYKDKPADTISVESVTVTPSEVTLDKIDGKAELSAEITPDDATNKSVNWLSSDPKVATVSIKGVVTAVGEGEATITAEAADGSGKSGSALVQVKLPRYEVTVTNATLGGGETTGSFKEGDEVTITATIPAGKKFKQWNGLDGIDGVTTTDETVTFNMPAKVLTVSAEVEDIKVSEVTVTAEGGKTNITVGETTQLIAEIKPADAANPAIEWSSSDETIATVDANGLVTGVGEGDVIITGKPADGSEAFDTIQIKVTVTKYKLEVTGGLISGGTADGTTSGNYAEGEEVTLKASVPAGKKFKQWNGLNGIDGVTTTDETVTFKMPKKNVTAEAIFENAATPTPAPDTNPTPTPAPVVKPTAAPAASVPAASTPILPSVGSDGTPLGNGASLEAAARAITSTGSEEGPAGSAYGLLQAKIKKAKNNAITIKWTRVPGAAQYVIYGNQCGKKMVELGRSGGSTFTLNKTPDGKKLKKGTYHKFLVVAVKGSGSAQTVVAASKVIHIATTGGKAANLKSLKLNKTKVKLKVKKTFKIKAKATKKGSKLKNHRKISYESSNPLIATVNKSGKVKALKKGSCKIYVYGQDGTSKVLKVTVK